MEIRVTQVAQDRMKPKPADESQLGFGEILTDHMFKMDWETGKGWINPRVEPYGPIPIDPAAMVLHYGQEVFEGLKAYTSQDGGIYLFRPQENFKRINRSAARLCMPQVDVDLAMAGMKELILLDREWVPKTDGTSLYIRPTMIATEPHLGVRPSNTYLFYIIIGPVGAYYKEGLNPVKIYVEDFYVRAAIGGTGEAKTSGNYAASLLAAEEAKKKGFTQVLWLDAKEKKYVEEVGTMNMFFVIEDEVITAPLNGSILPGVTRDSVIRIVREWGMRLSERSLTIDEVIEAARDGRLREAFGTGTAAVISPVGQITYKDEDYIVGGGRMGELSQKLYDEIVAIQYGHKPDPYGWVERIV
ncbi:MAG: branched-chain amino acid aminotransferase [Deltaproteobacteria bacterium]|nr:branched-chain amino acid aminotransferase [Deltaproteobacteria bacterium]MBW2048337.1 branched-chain amino acid aminotransferase [Deltaproteobacteria bacterium]MBW2111764.1 branched-chain amino acid aminotransferase [Deltaproteobacteria bacterium]MBW2352786.1 branched-chain amino acid aminotransferase [Deltaproteobacteria bacterium]